MNEEEEWAEIFQTFVNRLKDYVLDELSMDIYMNEEKNYRMLGDECASKFKHKIALPFYQYNYSFAQ